MFVASKMIENLHTNLYSDDDMLFFYENSGIVTFCFNEMGILSIDINNFKLDDTKYDEDDPETIIYIRHLAWHNKFEKCKALKKELNEELMLIAWYPRRWWDFYM